MLCTQCGCRIPSVCALMYVDVCAQVCMYNHKYVYRCMYTSVEVCISLAIGVQLPFQFAVGNGRGGRWSVGEVRHQRADVCVEMEIRYVLCVVCTPRPYGTCICVCLCFFEFEFEFVFVCM